MSIKDAFSLAHIATALLFILFELLVFINRKYLGKKS